MRVLHVENVLTRRDDAAGNAQTKHDQKYDEPCDIDSFYS